MAAPTVFVISVDNVGLICLNARIWNYALLQIKPMCLSNDRVLSIVIPRFFIPSEGSISQPWSSNSTSRLSRMASFSSAESPSCLDLSWDHFVWTSQEVFCCICRVCPHYPSLIEDLSEYIIACHQQIDGKTPNDEIPCAIGDTNRLNNIGPSTLPCGTPYVCDRPG